MTQSLLAEYFPILVFLGIAAVIASAMVGGAMLVARQKPNPEKLSAYECGFEPFDDTRRRFDVRFYLVAILFIIFRFGSGLPVPLGHRARGDRVVRLPVDDGLPRRADRGLRL